jgi:hypothetical protein
MTDLTKEQLEIELGRAYRAVRGFYHAIQNSTFPTETMLAYHSPTIAAAMRFVNEGALDGADYFIGKHVSVLHEALRGEQPNV